jgi:hypothetical protein
MAVRFPDDRAMNKSIAAGLLCLATLLSATLATSAAACERHDPEANGDDRTRHVRLSSAMDDAAILRALRLQPDRGEVTRSQTKDSISSKYVYFHRTVTIVRTASGEVKVEMLEKERKPLVWKLGAC